jgi:hypothetical protein
VSAAFATFVEEIVEALTAAGLLVAVLPRPVMPGTPLRRWEHDLAADLRAPAGLAA